MDKRKYGGAGLVCLTIFFLTSYSFTATRERKIVADFNFDHVIHVIQNLPKVHPNLTKSQKDQLFKLINTTLIDIRKKQPEAPVLTALVPSALLPVIASKATSPDNLKFPIVTPTFDIGLHHRSPNRDQKTRNRETTKYILGNRADGFYNKAKDPLIEEVQPRRFEYIINNETICKSASDLSIIIAVYTAPRNFAERNTIRQSWGRLSLLLNHTTRTVFFLGAVTDPKLQEQIAAESKTNGDIVQTNFIDSYHNLSLKGISQLQWLKDHCSNAKFLVKADDDLYVDMFQVIKTVNVLKPMKRFIIGFLYGGAVIIRGGIKKWTVKRHLMPGHRGYPPYYLGWIYVLPNTVFEEMYTAAMTTPIFHIDDVYVTGLLAGQLPNFSYLTFWGKVPPNSFMPTHPKLAGMSDKNHKVQTFCEQLGRLRIEDKKLIDESKLKGLLAEDACVKATQAVALAAKQKKEKEEREKKERELKAKNEKAAKEKKAADAKAKKENEAKGQKGGEPKAKNEKTEKEAAERKKEEEKAKEEQEEDEILMDSLAGRPNMAIFRPPPPKRATNMTTTFTTTTVKPAVTKAGNVTKQGSDTKPVPVKTKTTHVVPPSKEKPKEAVAAPDSKTNSTAVITKKPAV